MNTNPFGEHEVRQEIHPMPMFRDSLSIARIATLHPKVRDTFSGFVLASEAELNVTLRITQALRTIAEQNALYAQGRTKPGKIVTNAKGGTSYHNYGLAIDLVEMIDGKPNWNFDYSKLKPIAQRFNIGWGGDFRSFKDKPHFEITFGHKPSRLATMRKDANGYVIL